MSLGLPWAVAQLVVGVGMIASASILVTGFFWWTWANLLGGAVAGTAGLLWTMPRPAIGTAAAAFLLYAPANLLVLTMATAGGRPDPILTVPAVLVLAQVVLLAIATQTVRAIRPT